MGGYVAEADDRHVVYGDGRAALHGDPSVGATTGGVYAHIGTASPEQRLPLDDNVGRSCGCWPLD